MNLLFFVLAFLSPIVMGYVLISLCWPDTTMTYPLFWLKICLSTGIGFGLASLTSFFTLLVAGSANILVTFLLEAVVIGLFVIIVRQRQQPLFPTLLGNSEEPTTLSKLLAFVFYASLLLAAGVFIFRSFENPHGEPDAFYLWNACARFLFRSGEEWRSMFTARTWSHPDYPLLVPANILRLWSAYGKETFISPNVFAFFSTFSTIGMLVSALWILRGRTQASLGGIILTSTPYFVKHGASQYADVPLSFYVLATLVLITLFDAYAEKRTRIAFLTGITLGCAVWTKNEGILFTGGVFFMYILTKKAVSRTKRFFREELVLFLWGLLPLLLIVISFKIAIAPANDLVAGQNVHDILEKLTNFPRYLVTGKAFIRHMIEPYSLIYSTPIALFFVYALFMGIDWAQFTKPGVLISLFTLLIMLFGYFFIYIITPHDLSWHLSTSLSRLFLQLWPSAIFMALLVIARPGEHDRH